jgi:hypothetical protein
MQENLASYGDLAISAETTSWAQSLFPENFLSILPNNCNRKQFKKLNQEGTVKFYQQMST